MLLLRTVGASHRLSEAGDFQCLFSALSSETYNRPMESQYSSFALLLLIESRNLPNVGGSLSSSSIVLLLTTVLRVAASAREQHHYV